MYICVHVCLYVLLYVCVCAHAATTTTSTNTGARGTFNCRSSDPIRGSTAIGQPVVDDDADLTTAHTYFTTVAYRDFGVTNITVAFDVVSGICQFQVVDPTGSVVQDTGKLSGNAGSTSVRANLTDVAAGAYSVELRGSDDAGST